MRTPGKRKKAGHLTGEQLSLLIARCNLTGVEFAKLMEVNPETLYSYTGGRRNTPIKVSYKALALLRKVTDRANLWLNTIKDQEPHDVIFFDLQNAVGPQRKLREAALALVLTQLDPQREYEIVN